MPETAERIVGEGMARFGRIDSLVNNAGVFLSKPFIDFTAEDYALNIGVNVSGFSLSDLNPVGRMGEIRDIVDAVLCLEQACFVTGEILHVDGGQNAGRW